MYADEPGDLKQEEEELAEQRAEAIEEAKQGGEGKLTMEGDKRGKGPGIV
jgi:membrane protein implicated in regulation of membrane protease activity